MPIIQPIISGGSTPTGTKQITANGTHNVASYEYADVQVPTTAPAHYIDYDVDNNGNLIKGSSIMNFNGVTKICGPNKFAFAYTYATSITGTVDMSSITQIIGYYTCWYSFSYCSNITSVDLRSLTTISAEFPSAGYTCEAMFRETGITSVDLRALSTIYGISAANTMFYSCNSLTSMNLPSLTTIDGENACRSFCQQCVALTTVNLGSLQTITGKLAAGYSFYQCRNLISIDLSSLSTIDGESACENMFYGTKLTDLALNLSSLTTVSGIYCCRYMFQNSKIASVVFSSLSKIPSTWAFRMAFSNCTSLQFLSFPALNANGFSTVVNQFNNMLSGVTGCTVHFPSNLQSVIGGWTDVTNGFGGTNTTILWDLPATNTLTGADSITYTRNPKYDTATALAWKSGNYDSTTLTPAYYTNGTTDPQVSNTIYSDSACTVAVTTISLIS